MFQTKVVENIKTSISCFRRLFKQSSRLWDVEKLCLATYVLDNKIIHVLRMHNTVFPRQQMLHECLSVLDSTYIVRLTATPVYINVLATTCDWKLSVSYWMQSYICRTFQLTLLTHCWFAKLYGHISFAHQWLVIYNSLCSSLYQ
jgi:hypothetical protein